MRIFFFFALCSTVIFTHEKQAFSRQNTTPTNTGFIGLNTIPTARQSDKNTIRIGFSNLDPYLHAYIGLQISDPLFINIRQTAEISNINKKAKALYPGIDFKLRIHKETKTQPQVSIGAQSAFGHKRMAGEFLALSKRYNNLDFTAGLGWGRFATAKTIKNPLKTLGNHFSKERNMYSEDPNTPAHWFTGEYIGIFGGVEYTTPINGLSLKLDYGSDRYTAEKQLFNYTRPAPWSAGLSYAPTEWINAAIAIQGTDKIMSRLTFQTSPEQWPLSEKKYTAPTPIKKQRGSNKHPDIEKIIRVTNNNGINLSNIHHSRHSFFAEIEIPKGANTPKHIGHAIRQISAHSGSEIEEIIVTPTHNGLRGTSIKILLRDVENMVDKNQGSPEEMWKNVGFVVTEAHKQRHNIHSSYKGISQKTHFFLTQENQISLSEEDSGHLYRSSLIGHAKTSPFLGFFTNASLRLNLSDNLEHLDELRPQSSYTTKGNINAFTKKRITLENAFIGYTHSITPSLHTAITAGYLEEQYAGIGGEIIYRPFSSRLAFGAEIHHVLRRNPHTPFNAGLIEGSTTSGYINAWYDIPNHDITLSASAGRFLATDIGVKLGLEKAFKNGAKINSKLTISNHDEADIFGGTTHTYHSIALTLPIGSLTAIPSDSHIKTTIAPFGRNIAQSIDKPFSLHDETENFTLKHIADHWDDVLQ